MHLGLFLRGLAIGFAVAAPVGPIGMLVIRRTLAAGRWLGLITGLGAAVADALYGCVGAFGLTFIASVLMGYAFWTRLIGGLFLIYLGISTFMAKPGTAVTDGTHGRYLTAFLSTAMLTLANPATILSFMAVFAGLGVGMQAGDYSAASTVVVGVFAGSALWWLLLSAGVAWVRHKLKPRTLRWINYGAGAFLSAFGVYALMRLAI